MLEALKRRDFRAYLGGNFFAINGLWIQRVVIGWLAWDLTSSVFWTGIIGFSLFAPVIVCAPFFGVIADRKDLRVMIALVQAALCTLSIALLLAHHAGFLNIWVLSAVALLIGVANSAHHPTRMAIGPRLVPVALISQTVALASMNFNVCRMLGPAVGGLLIAQWGVATTLVVNVLLFIPLTVVVFSLHPRQVDSAVARERTMLGALADGGRYALGHTVISAMYLITIVNAFTGRAMLELLPAVADGVYERGAAGFGQMTAAAGLGAVVATMMLARLRHAEQRLPGIIGITVMAVSVCVSLAGFDLTWWGSLLLISVLGGVATATGIGAQTVCQYALEEQYRARVMSLWSVLGFGGTAFGALVLGALADLFGLSSTLLLAGVLGVLTSLWLYVSNRRR